MAEDPPTGEILEVRCSKNTDTISVMCSSTSGAQQVKEGLKEQYPGLRFEPQHSTCCVGIRADVVFVLQGLKRMSWKLAHYGASGGDLCFRSVYIFEK